MGSRLKDTFNLDWVAKDERHGSLCVADTRSSGSNLGIILYPYNQNGDRNRFQESVVSLFLLYLLYACFA